MRRPIAVLMLPADSIFLIASIVILTTLCLVAVAPATAEDPPPAERRLGGRSGGVSRVLPGPGFLCTRSLRGRPSSIRGTCGALRGGTASPMSPPTRQAATRWSACPAGTERRTCVSGIGRRCGSCRRGSEFVGSDGFGRYTHVP